MLLHETPHRPSSGVGQTDPRAISIQQCCDPFPRLASRLMYPAVAKAELPHQDSNSTPRAQRTRFPFPGRSPQFKSKFSFSLPLTFSRLQLMPAMICKVVLFVFKLRTMTRMVDHPLQTTFNSKEYREETESVKFSSTAIGHWMLDCPPILNYKQDHPTMLMTVVTQSTYMPEKQGEEVNSIGMSSTTILLRVLCQ